MSDEIWKYKDSAQDLTRLALDHYVLHRLSVLKKLQIVQSVMSDQFDSATLWQEIIDLFGAKPIGEEDLFKIEALLARMPEPLSSQCRARQNEDLELQDLLKRLDHDAYKKVKSKIKHVQEQENPVTGLTAHDYEQDLFVHLKSFFTP